MFHMLGGFALTSFFSRTSSRGCSISLTRSGFCCCETSPLNVFIIGISIHPSFETEICWVAMFHDTHMGPFSPITRSRRPKIFGTRTTAEAKMWHRRGRVDRALLSRNAARSSNATSGLGKRMAIIPMIPVGPVTTLNRSIILAERPMSGTTGGDDFICGHCGHVMLEDFDPSTVRGNPVYQCGVCENNNDLPFAASDGRHWRSR